MPPEYMRNIRCISLYSINMHWLTECLCDPENTAARWKTAGNDTVAGSDCAILAIAISEKLFSNVVNRPRKRRVINTT